MSDPSEVNIPKTPKEITPENFHLVDFETLNVRLLCLVEDKTRFEAVSGFLVRRGWDIHATEKMKDALKAIGDFKPDFVLMSVNNPHPKLSHFPQIVQHTFKVQVIAFGEAADAFTMKRMQSIQANHKLTGLVSGPMVQRRVKQILHEIHQPEKKIDESSGSSAGHNDNAEAQGAIRIAGAAEASDGSVFMFSKDAEVDAGTVTSDTLNEQVIRSEASGESQKRTKDVGKIITTVPKFFDSRTPQNYAAKDQRDGSQKADYFEGLIKGLVEEIAYTEATTTPAPLQQVRHMGILSVAYNQTFGYLMLTMSGEQGDITEVLEGLRKRIIQKSASDQRAVELGDLILIQVDDYDFVENQILGFRFCFVRPIGAREIGVKFVHNEGAWARVNHLDRHDKIQVSVSQIPENRNLEFDLFIYLRMNRRYYRVVNQNSALTTERKNRLMGNKANVFIEPDAIRTFKKFVTKTCASDAIEQAIKEGRKGRKGRNAS